MVIKTMMIIMEIVIIDDDGGCDRDADGDDDCGDELLMTAVMFLAMVDFNGHLSNTCIANIELSIMVPVSLMKQVSKRLDNLPRVTQLV